MTNAKNQRKVEAVLSKAQHKCTARVLKYADVINILNIALERLKSLNFTQKELQGVRLTYQYNEKLPHSYGYRADSTHFTAIYKNNSWHLERVYRDVMGNSVYKSYIFTFTDEQKEKLLEKVSIYQTK